MLVYPEGIMERQKLNISIKTEFSCKEREFVISAMNTVKKDIIKFKDDVFLQDIDSIYSSIYKWLTIERDCKARTCTLTSNYKDIRIKCTFKYES